MNVAVLLSVLTSARSRGSHADVAERKSHSATMQTNTMMSAFVVRIFHCKLPRFPGFLHVHWPWALRRRVAQRAPQRKFKVGRELANRCGDFK